MFGKFIFKRVLCIIGIAGLLQACSPSPSEVLPGTWQVDSAYYYYNGFDYTSTSLPLHETYEYQQDGILIVRNKEEQKQMHYQLQDNALAYRNAQGDTLSQFQILHVDANHLVLKKAKDPVFQGVTAQDRYEIRYFSKVDSR